jgi:hypothetical protein
MFHDGMQDVSSYFALDELHPTSPNALTALRAGHRDGENRRNFVSSMVDSGLPWHMVSASSWIIGGLDLSIWIHGKIFGESRQLTRGVLSQIITL